MTRDFHRLLVDESPDALIATASDGTVLHWNRGAGAIFGYSPEEAVDRRLADLIMVNNTGRIVLVNTQAETMFGHQRADLLGKPVEELLPPRFRSGHVVHRTGFLQEARMRRMGAGLELFGLRKDGGEFPVEIGLSPLVTDEGTLRRRRRIRRCAPYHSF